MSTMSRVTHPTLYNGCATIWSLSRCQRNSPSHCQKMVVASTRKKVECVRVKCVRQACDRVECVRVECVRESQPSNEVCVCVLFHFLTYVCISSCNIHELTHSRQSAMGRHWPQAHAPSRHIMKTLHSQSLFYSKA